MAPRMLLLLVVAAVAVNAMEIEEPVTVEGNSASRKMLACGSIPLCCQTYNQGTCSCEAYRPGSYWDELKGCVTVAYDDDGDFDYDDGTIFDHLRIRLSKTRIGSLILG